MSQSADREWNDYEWAEDEWRSPNVLNKWNSPKTARQSMTEKKERHVYNDKCMGALDFRQWANVLGVYWRNSGGDSPILAIIDSSNRYTTGRHWITQLWIKGCYAFSKVARVHIIYRGNFLSPIFIFANWQISYWNSPMANILLAKFQIGEVTEAPYIDSPYFNN